MAKTSPTSLNTDDIVLWFDALGTDNPLSFLSNFHEGDPITLEGVTWEALAEACRIPSWLVDDATAAASRFGPIEFITGEHAFAALKFWGSDFEHFCNIVDARDTEYMDWDRDKQAEVPVFLSAPNHAKSLGRSRSHPLRPDWEVVKLDVMAAITRAKYAVGRAEATMLLETGDRLLVEGTYWGDDVWGVDLSKPSMPGRNWLGSLLMMRRAELRAVEAATTGSQKVSKFVANTGGHNARFVR